MKPVDWIGSSYKDFRTFPEPVQSTVGFALYLAQIGQRHNQAKPLKGFHGAGVLEVVEDHHGDTYRAIYTVRYEHAIYVLHAFQKKSRKGIKTPIQDIDLIRLRLRQADLEHEARQRGPQ